MRKADNICIYRHIRLDNNEIFYIGIGSVKRANSKSKRSKFWNSIIKKTDYIIDILKKDLNWKDACELEKILISYYGRRDLRLGTLVNLTDGGDGSIGNIRSKETRNKISNSMKGISKSSNTKEKMKIAQKKIIKNPNSRTFRKIINVETNEVFESIKSAANSINRLPSSFWWLLNNSKNFNFKYYE